MKEQYDVRESASGEGSGVGGGEVTGRGAVRNLGKPVALCQRYYADGADEVVFLNITSFRQGVMGDLPMLQVLERASENVFVPLTVGGGIREYTDDEGRTHSAVEVAAQYFRAGADKVSIGSDAVFAAEEYISAGRVKSGLSSVETISQHYGAQAVVVSIDPKRVYVAEPALAPAGCTVCAVRVASKTEGSSAESTNSPRGEERYCWWQATVKGGREGRDICAITLARACEELGAGELMVNCIDMDGQGTGYDLELLSAVQAAVSIPVIASSGAGRVEHFSQVFRETGVMAALAAGIFHRGEVRIQDVKAHLTAEGIPARQCA